MTYVDEYLTNLIEPQKSILTKICKVVRELAPQAEETRSYGLPAFRHKGHYLMGFAANTTFMSIYPASHAIELVTPKLVGFEFSKGAIRFTPNNQLPEALLREILSIRISDIDNT